MKLRRNIVLVAAALLLISSFLLPNAVAGITDARRLDNLVMIDSQTVSFDAVPALSLPERIELVANSNTEHMALRTGSVMNLESAESRAIRELMRFFRGGPFEFDPHEYTVEESAAVFIIDPEMPTVNMRVWELTLSDVFDNLVTVTLDDETGMIVKIIYRQGRRNQDADGINNASPAGRLDEELQAKASRLAEMMAAYYGMRVTLVDYELSGSMSYYRADISGNGRTIPTYGVVRATSFTMNERV
jgi:hypothetical protein